MKKSDSPWWQVEAMVHGSFAIARSNFSTLMRTGDTEAALRALHEEVCE